MHIIISDSIELKSITREDYPDLLKLMQRIYPPAYSYLWPDNGDWYLQNVYGKEKVASDLAEENGGFYFVEVQGTRQGILKIQEDKPYPELPNAKATRLHRIYLSEEVQGRGISSKLMHFVEKVAIKNGSALIWLDCMDSKIQALRFYEKHGFEKGPLTHLDYRLIREGFHGIYLMWKPLQGI